MRDFNPSVVLYDFMFPGDGCSTGCGDYNRFCPALTDPFFASSYQQLLSSDAVLANFGSNVPPTPISCDNDFYKVACPMSCNQCKFSPIFLCDSFHFLFAITCEKLTSREWPKSASYLRLKMVKGLQSVKKTLYANFENVISELLKRFIRTLKTFQQINKKDDHSE